MTDLHDYYKFSLEWSLDTVSLWEGIFEVASTLCQSNSSFVSQKEHNYLQLKNYQRWGGPLIFNLDIPLHKVIDCQRIVGFWLFFPQNKKLWKSKKIISSQSVNIGYLLGLRPFTDLVIQSATMTSEIC